MVLAVSIVPVTLLPLTVPGVAWSPSVLGSALAVKLSKTHPPGRLEVISETS